MHIAKGLFKKAESLINHAETGKGITSVDVWYCLARGCLEYNQIPEAVEAMRRQSLFVHLDGSLVKKLSGYLCGIFGREGRCGRCR